jgi:predicted Zn-dependent protease
MLVKNVYAIWFMTGLLMGMSLLSGCTGSKDAASSSFDMSEYRKMMDRQKGAEGSFEDPAPSAPDMTAEEHERAGDVEAHRRSFTMAGLHYDKALKADSSRNSVRLKLGQIFFQQGLLEPAIGQFEDLRKREPKSATAHEGIGQVYLQQGKVQ